MAKLIDDQDQTAITAAVRALEASWNSNDLDAMAQLYTAEVHWVNVRGMHWRGIEEVDRAHRVYFDLMFEDVNNDLIEIESVTPVTSDVAIAVVVWAIGAFTTPDGQLIPPGRTRMTIVYKRTDAGWKIAHGHNEDIDEFAQQFDPIRGSAKRP